MNYTINIPKQANSNTSGISLFKPEYDFGLKLTNSEDGQVLLNGKTVKPEVYQFYVEHQKDTVINKYLEEAERLKKKRLHSQTKQEGGDEVESPTKR
jgi:hypothetical protein